LPDFMAMGDCLIDELEETRTDENHGKIMQKMTSKSVVERGQNGDKTGINMGLKTVSIDSILPHPKNPRVHPQSAISKLVKSFAEFGWTNPVLISEDNFILAGHARVKAAQEAGIKEVPAITLPFKGMSAKGQAYLIADNRLQDETDWDDLKLGELVAELRDLDYDLELAGFNGDEINELLADAPHDEEFECEVDDSAPPITQIGDLIVIGKHRLLCGDCTDKANVERLMGKDESRLMVTDPPYGVEYDSAWRSKYSSGEYSVGKILNDNRADWSDVFGLFNCDVLYVWHGGLHADVVATGLRNVGYDLRAQIIWNKGVMVFGRGAYHWKHEPCWFAVKTGCKAYWIGDHSQNTVWDCENNSGASRTNDKEDDYHANHISQKPVKLIAKAIINHESDIVVDPFLGSGSTLIAAEQLNRRCYGMEIEPKYCDVIVRRWISYVGEDKAPKELVEKYHADAGD
jgi:DNA modification methylase